MIVVIGQRWLGVRDDGGQPRLHHADDFLRREIELALTAGVTVIPTLVEGARMPRPSELPASLLPLLERQSFELRDGRSFRADARSLAEVVGRLLSA